MTPLNLGIIASHSGSNLQEIIDATKSGKLQANPCVVISNNGDSIALARARNEGIDGYHLSGRTHPAPEALDEAILQVLVAHNVELVVLAGYMKKLGAKTLQYFAGRILNIHPALLPKYGGQGLYGRHVHEAVLDAGERSSGVTIHLVSDEYDTGPIIAQCEVPVCAGDTVATLAERVLQREHAFYIETLQKISNGSIIPSRSKNGTVMKHYQGQLGNRIMIIGSGGAGKSTLARRLGEITGLPVIHLDVENWQPGWVETPKDEWKCKVEALASEDRWIIDGNYSGTLPVRLQKADTVIFLDYPRWVCLWRVLKRQIIYRGRTRPDLTPGCIERLEWEFVKWIWVDFPRRSRPRLLGHLEEYREGREIIIHHSSGETRRWLTEIGGGQQLGRIA